MATALYNDNDPFAAAWLESLITHGHIAQGQVDRRSIADLGPADVAGPGQRHYFAGIGGWSYALRLAGVPDDADIWTGSCPCQPFSDAGKGQGVLDPRHLWPAWFALIRECRPPIIFGEQVASKDGLGWLDAVSTDLERCGYTVGAADLCAASVGAPHARQRLYFVAYTDRVPRGLLVRERGPRHADAQAGGGGEDGGLAGQEAQDQGGRDAHRLCDLAVPAGATGGFWADADWILCRDPTGGPPVARPVEPGTFPLSHGTPGRVGLLRGYGNAIVPQLAAAFIRSALEAIADVLS